MMQFNPEYSYKIHPIKGIQVQIEDNLNKFNASLLDIGDLRSPCQSVEVLAVIFDVEGFTLFTKQVDPQLTIPHFVSDLFNWIFSSIIESLVDKEQENTLWAELPFFSKFIGDGVIFLWKIDMNKILTACTALSTDKQHEHIDRFVCNIVASLYNFSKQYPLFLNKAKKKYIDPPPRIRCGIARGNVFPIGNGKDYVGPCINIASRLQKFHNLSFVFSTRGISMHGFNIAFEKIFVQKKVAIRGIGEQELVSIVKDEFVQLEAGEKTYFHDP